MSLLLLWYASCDKTNLPRGSGVVNTGDNALDKRAKKTVGQGKVEHGGSSDELYTEGLATCIGAAAVGTADKDKKIDKILAHVSAANPTGGSYTKQFENWEKEVKDSKMKAVKIYLSVPARDVVPAACKAMGDMIDRAKQSCKNLGYGCATLERKNEDVTKPPPHGTVQIKANKDVFMEGKKVS